MSQAEDGRFAVVTAEVGCPDLELIDVDEQRFGLHNRGRTHEVARASRGREDGQPLSGGGLAAADISASDPASGRFTRRSC